MNRLFEVRENDRIFYEKHIRDFVPDEIIDFHTHVWLAAMRMHRVHEFSRQVSWPARVARENPIEDLRETYRLMFPGKKVTSLIFTSFHPGDDLDVLNDYVRRAAATVRFPALLWSSPAWSPEELEKKILEGGFLGAKPYLNGAPPHIPTDEIRIYDFITRDQLAVLNKRKLILVLHLPRPGRLKDPVNLVQMREIERAYPDIKLVIAHVGRAYCPEDVGNAWESISGTEKIWFDISANTNTEVFAGLIRTVGAGRIIFGSDLPVARMRMRRICEKGRYVNMVPPGLYGDISGDPHMREVDLPEAERLTFFMYEEIAAFRRAAEQTGLTPADIELIFHKNAHSLIAEFRG